MGGSTEQRSLLSRRGFIALAGGSAATVAIAACGSDEDAEASETAEFGDGDVGILNYALTLEYLQTAFYADLIGSDLFKGRDLATMRKFGEEETEHVEALTKAVEGMDGEPAAKPKAEFPLEGTKPALALGEELENLTAAAYLGQVPHIESPSAMKTVLSIHSVEGRHAATFAVLQDKPFTADGEFAKPASAKDVLASIKPFMTN
jgi:hypothetical protein